MIPASRINPITLQYLKFFPEPNVAGVNSTSRPDGYFNYGTTAPNVNQADNESGQLDYNMSDEQPHVIQRPPQYARGQEE